ncbi:MAG: TrkA C-terminal domain-containing protein [Limosilactobacillus mucosae]
MIAQIQHFLIDQQIFTLFICLALGYVLGNIKLFGTNFTLGSTVGTLAVALVVGQAGSFPRDKMLGTIFFGAFMFSIGYRIGPSFLVSMKLFGGRMIAVSLFWLLAAFLTSWGCFVLFHLGPGVAAGTIAGSLTQSATVASSLQALENLPITKTLRLSYEAQLPVAYALTYVFGTLGVIILLRDVAPRLLKIDVPKQGDRMARKYHFHAPAPDPTWRRTYRLAAESPLVGKKIREINEFFDLRLIALAAFHQDRMTDKLEYVLQAGDRLTLIGYALHFDDLTGITGLTEVLTPTNAPRERKFVLGKNFDSSTLARIRQNGVFVNIHDPLSGQEHLINQLKPGDVISLTGNTSKSAPLLKQIGRWHTSEQAINYTVFSLGIAGASLLGLVGIKVNGMPLQLGNGTAALIMGLLLSSWIDRHHECRSIPATVTSFWQSFGLTVFVGSVGLESAQAFTGAIKSLGFGILLIGALVSVAPHLLTLLFGRFVLRVEPLALLGALCGSGTVAAAMNDLAEQAGLEGGAYLASAFTPAFVVGNIGITLLGPLFVAILS